MDTDRSFEFHQRIIDLMRSAKSLEIRWLNDGDPFDDTRKRKVESLPAMQVSPHNANYNAMKDNIDFSGFRRCPRCLENKYKMHTQLKVPAGVDDRTRDEYGAIVHACKACGYLRWYAYNEGVETPGAPPDGQDEFTGGDDAFDYSADYSDMK